MARAAKATTTTRRTAPAAPPKKVGRPVGSKNRVAATTKPKVAPVAKKAALRSVSAKAAPAPARLNKAELEAQVVKLERSLARAKKQNAELKVALKDAQATPVAATPAAPVKATREKAPPTAVKRGRKPKAESSKIATSTDTTVD